MTNSDFSMETFIDECLLEAVAELSSDSPQCLEPGCTYDDELSQGYVSTESCILAHKTSPINAVQKRSDVGVAFGTSAQQPTWERNETPIKHVEYNPSSTEYSTINLYYGFDRAQFESFSEFHSQRVNEGLGPYTETREGKPDTSKSMAHTSAGQTISTVSSHIGWTHGGFSHERQTTSL